MLREKKKKKDARIRAKKKHLTLPYENNAKKKKHKFEKKAPNTTLQKLS